MKSKKLLLGSLSAMALVATPIATVVSCGKKDSAAVTYTKLDANTLKAYIATLDAMPHTEDNPAYKKYLKDQFLPYVKADGKTPVDTKSIDDITATDAANGNVLKGAKEAAEAIEAWTRPVKKGNGTIMIGTEEIKLDKVLTDAEFKKLQGQAATIKTAGNAAVVAAALDATKVALSNKMVDAAADEAAILEILTHFATDVQGTAISPSTVTSAQGTGATKLAAQKTAAKALLTTANAFTKAETEVKTAVTILGKDYTLKSFVAKPIMLVSSKGTDKDIASKKVTLTFRGQINDDATYGEAVKAQLNAWKLFADDKGTKLNFTKFDEQTLSDGMLKEAKALLVDGIYTSLKK